MPLWKSLLLTLYYHVSMPVRWWYHKWDLAAHRVPLMVLLYHRIADDDATPWTISNRTFARQIRWLKDHCEMISLEETQRRIRDGVNDRRAVSITFDDGYSENCRHAIPLLVKEGIPCTCFVAVKNVLEGVPFDHDLARCQRFPPHTLEQLRAMAAAGIEIGTHTYTHADLGRVTDPGVLHAELVLAGRELQAAIGRPVRYFAFPFGQRANLSREAFALARQAGYEAACSAYGGFNLPGGDAFHLYRIPVDGTTIRLKNWVTGDPRKRNFCRFEYSRTPDHVSTPSPRAVG